jgi:hypothetical protein
MNCSQTKRENNMKSTGDSKYSARLALVLHSGEKVYPVRMKNRDTGTFAFRISDGSNKKELSVEVPEEDRMIQMVLTDRRSVRCCPLNTSLASIYGLGRRSVAYAELDGIRQS